MSRDGLGDEVRPHFPAQHPELQLSGDLCGALGGTRTPNLLIPDPEMVRKNGIKLWADGSPWLGNVALSFPYLDTDRVRDAEIIIGPLAVGKYADLVELSNDPYMVDPHHLEAKVKVRATWLGGRKLNLKAFVNEVATIDPTQHHHLHHVAAGRKRCC